jgi:hypothetical protein
VIAVSQTLGNPGRAGSFGVESVPLPLTPGPPRARDRDPSENRRVVRSPIRLAGQEPGRAQTTTPRTTWREAIVTVEQLLDRGETDAPTIAKRIGVKLDTLYQSLQKYGRDDLWKRMTNRARSKPSVAAGRQLSWKATVPVIEQLLDQGVTDAAVIGDTLGILPSGVFNGLKRQNRRDLWARMTNRGASSHRQTFTQSTRRPRKATMAEKKRRIAVEVRKVTDPAGDPGVLIQLPPGDSWVVLSAADARRIALLDTADELDPVGDGE